jgi:hypothetical protein
MRRIERRRRRGVRGAMQQGRDAIREAPRELDEVIDEIRRVPGYESFLAGTTTGLWEVV